MQVTSLLGVKPFRDGQRILGRSHRRLRTQFFAKISPCSETVLVDPIHHTTSYGKILEGFECTCILPGGQDAGVAVVCVRKPWVIVADVAVTMKVLPRLAC
jgi:hypothetical protein